MDFPLCLQCFTMKEMKIVEYNEKSKIYIKKIRTLYDYFEELLLIGKCKRVENMNKKSRDRNSKRNCTSICIKIGSLQGDEKI